MTKWLWMSCMLVFATTSVAEAQAPANSAQWSVDSGTVSSLNFNRLYNTLRAKHLSVKSTGDVYWATEEAGHGTAFFENCTRGGEVVYGSDRVAIRFGTRFLIATSPSARGWTSDRAAACQYRLIPSGGGLVPAGSGDKKFAIYNMENDRYLVYKDGWLVWQKIDGTPGGPVASADFVPTELLFTGTTAYLTIKNIGNVRSSASQQIMKVIIQGQRVDFEVIQPVEPGASLRDTIRMNGPLSQCVLVEIDADPVKFQVLPGALPNDFVFLNDRRNMTARQLGSSTAIAQPPCEPIIVQ